MVGYNPFSLLFRLAKTFFFQNIAISDKYSRQKKLKGNLHIYFKSLLASLIFYDTRSMT